ncbi:MAG TPA: cation diffusion facilitator family transporter [Thermoplasmata archaeon]|nr:cation diffusion facilitator family transporter [Thermoplasmata archaeon]
MRPQVILVATLLLNAALFALNLWVAISSGSRVVLAEAIYAITDLTGSALLLWGLYLSRRPPDYEHPFGFGKERFFWAFVSIVVTFTTTGMVALVTGIAQATNPHAVTHIGEGLLVVGATLGVSLIGIWITLRELRISRETLSTLLESAHQGLKSVFYQDLVSIVGAVIAFVGLLVIYRTHDYALDGAIAALEGFLLVATGFVLTAESREYMIGRALDPGVALSMITLVERDPRVARVRSAQSMLLGPDDALVALRINFQDGLTTDQLEAAIDQVSLALKTTYPVVRHIIIEPES